MQTNETTEIPAPPAREVERLYRVALNGTVAVDVRLRWPAGQAPERDSEQARHEATKRAAKLRARKGDTTSYDLDDAGISLQRESLVLARPVKAEALTQLERKFAKPEGHGANPAARKAKHGRNGW